LKRTEGATRQKAFSLGLSLDTRACESRLFCSRCVLSPATYVREASLFATRNASRSECRARRHSHTLSVLRCSEVSPRNVAMGHITTFRARVRASAIAPKATGLLHCGSRRSVKG
jgi:hypothetical protein